MGDKDSYRSAIRKMNELIDEGYYLERIKKGSKTIDSSV